MPFSALWANLIIGRVWWSGLLNLVERNYYFFIRMLNPSVVSDTDADKKKVSLFVYVIKQIVFLITFGRKIHILSLEIKHKTFYVSVAKWHDLYGFIFGFSSFDPLACYARGKYKVSCLFLQLWDFSHRVQNLASAKLFDTFYVFVGNVGLRKAKNCEVLYYGDTIGGIGHVWGRTEEDLAFLLIFNCLFSYDAGHFGRKLFEILN